MKIKLLAFIGSVFFSANLVGQTIGLDPTFGNNGKVVTPLASTGGLGITGILVQPDGEIIVCSGNVYHGDFLALTRYHSNGSIDPSFGLNGTVVSQLTFGYGGVGNVIRFDANGKILLGGLLTVSTSALTKFDLGLMRFNPDGTIDSTFGTNGLASVDFFGKSDVIGAFEIQSDGKIVMAGSAGVGIPNSNSITNDFAVIRFNADGSLDDSFGNAGKVNYNFGFAYDAVLSNDAASSIKIQTDGKIILGGGTTQNNGNPTFMSFALMRLNTDGTIDTGYGVEGKVKTEIDVNLTTVIRSLAITPNDEIIAAGVVQYPGSVVAAMLTKYDSSGNLDLNFGTGGKVETKVNDASTTIYEMVLLNNGKLRCAGYVSFGVGAQDFLLLQYTADGALDTTFDNDGFVITDINNASDLGRSITIQPDGKTLCGGLIFYGHNALARFDTPLLNSDEFEVSQSFKVYPNPFVDTITLTVQLLKPELLSVSLIDVSGKKIDLASNRKFTSGQHSLQLDLPGQLSKGIYFLSVSDGRKNTVIKVGK